MANTFLNTITSIKSNSFEVVHGIRYWVLVKMNIFHFYISIREEI